MHQKELAGIEKMKELREKGCARIKNQEANKRLSVVPKEECAASHAKKTALRRQIKSNIRLSKLEIRERHRLISLIASGADALLRFALVCLPFFFGADYPPEYLIKTEKLFSVLITEVPLILTNIYLNFHLPRFIFGEKLAGIDRIFLEQQDPLTAERRKCYSSVLKHPQPTYLP